MTDYERAKKLSKKLGEHNDCAVVAAALTTKWSYEHTHRVFAECGRKKGRGTHLHVTRKALRRLGVYVEERKIRRTPVRNLRLPEGKRYIAVTCNHMLAVIDGKVHDWTANRRHVVTDLWEISL